MSHTDFPKISRTQASTKGRCFEGQFGSISLEYILMFASVLLLVASILPSFLTSANKYLNLFYLPDNLNIGDTNDENNND